MIEMSQRTRKLTLFVHIVSAGAWIGIDVIVGVLVIAGWFTADPSVQGVAYVALGTFAVGPMLAAGLACLVSGVLLGFGTRYGLIRYWWVVIKLVMNVVLCTLIGFLLGPGMPDLIEHGKALLGGAQPSLDVSTLFFPPTVSLTVLTAATFLAVFKPLGRLRASPRSRVDPARSRYL